MSSATFYPNGSGQAMDVSISGRQTVDPGEIEEVTTFKELLFDLSSLTNCKINSVTFKYASATTMQKSTSYATSSYSYRVINTTRKSSYQEDVNNDGGSFNVPVSYIDSNRTVTVYVGLTGQAKSNNLRTGGSCSFSYTMKGT